LAVGTGRAERPSLDALRRKPAPLRQSTLERNGH
jgi:hypothetical protein